MRKHICTLGMILAFLGGTFAARAQSSAPPIKLGLWQTTSTATISGIQLPPEIAARLKAMGRPMPFGQPTTTVIQSCVTQEKWEQVFRDTQRNHNCHFTNRHQTPTSLTADMTCKSNNGEINSTGHIDVSFQNQEAIHGKVHMETVEPSQPHPVATDVHFEGVYKGSDCHGISPDSPKVVH